MPTVKQLDDILLRGRLRFASERSLEAAGWLATVRERMPEPSFFDFRARSEWRAAFAVVASVDVTRRQTDAVFVPVWLCEQMEDSTNDEWRASVLLVWEDGQSQSFDERFDDDVAVAVRVERTRRANLAPARAYALDVPTLFRNRSYVALASDAPEQVLSITGIAASAGVPRPIIELPPWTSGAVAAIDLGALDELWARLGSPSAKSVYRAEGSRWRSLVEAAIAAYCGGPDEEEAEA